ncbi:MAG: chemotaxis protein CheA [Chthoniobacteraceae bacterium]
MSIPNHSATFLQEAEELLQQIEAVTLDLESSPGDMEIVNRLFRAFHTIKGSGSMFGFDAVAAFTHHVETTLDLVREGRLGITPPLVTLILASRDHIHTLLESDPAGSPALSEVGDRIAAELGRLSGADVAPAHVASTALANQQAELATYTIFFRPDPTIFLGGLDPVCLLNDLRSLGECAIETHCDAVPPLEELQPDHCYFAWTVTLATAQPETAIRDVFIFAEDGAELKIERRASSASVRVLAPVSAEAVSGEPARLEAVKVPVAVAAQKAAAPAASVRVPSERLDRLVNLVGELVINQSRLNQAQALSGDPDLAAPVESMERLIAELRDSVLGIRMMPIGATFSRFQRLVRDLASELGKEIDLVTEGAETELDKTVLDQLGDPLVHLIRNSLDHGIEGPDDRLAKGKNRRGTLRLTAAHEGAHVVITIEDDGRGLDKAALRAKAEEKGLIAPDAQLTEQETFNLIFLPGFSTAKIVSNVSGRGVGMDVVKRTIEGLRGSIILSSPEGRGTVIRLTLPLTLAIIDGLLVEIEGDRFIVPMTAVTENVELSRTERFANNGRNAVDVRGSLVPYIPLRDLFEIRGNEPELEKIVIVAMEGERLGLVVDRVIGSHQTVIQSLGPFYRDNDLFSGTTIMGDGRVAMILNLAGILRYATAQPASRPINLTK